MKIVKLNFIGVGQDVLDSLVDLQEILHFCIHQSGKQVCLNQCGSGIEIVNGKVASISYGSRNQLYYALYLLLANIDNDNYHTVQNCAFQQLTAMIDNSRNAVMNIDSIQQLVRYLAIFGYNQLMLYTEDTFQVANQPYFGYMRGAFTPQETKAIDMYCKQYGIELVPCVQTLAHFNQITRYSHYQQHIDCDDILLCEDDRTYQLIDDIFATLASNFSSRKVNIGMDESHNLGLGKYLEKHGYSTRYEIMIRHLNRVVEIATKYGFRCMMWSDMFFRLIFNGQYEGDASAIPQQLIQAIPQDITLIYWDYYSDKIEKYQRNLANHKVLSNNICFAGGAWRWMGFVGDNDYSVRTMQQSLKACKQHSISHYIVTCWGDDGGECSVFQMLPSLYYVGVNAYTPVDKCDANVDVTSFEYLYGITFSQYCQLDLPNKVVATAPLQRNNSSKFFLYNDLLLGTFDSLAYDGITNIYLQHIDAISSIDTSNCPYSYHFDRMIVLLQVLADKVELGKLLRKAYGSNDRQLLQHCADTIAAMVDRLQVFYDNFCQYWMKENKPFGLEVQQVRLGGLQKRWQWVQQQVLMYLDNNIAHIQELEQPILPFAYADARLEMLYFNDWKLSISACKV